MAAKLHHQHLHAHQERGYVTEVSIVYVTAGPSSPGSGAEATAAQQGAPSPSIILGSPVRAGGSSATAGAAASSTAYPSYPNRPQRPSGVNTSNAPLSTSAGLAQGGGSQSVSSQAIAVSSSASEPAAQQTTLVSSAIGASSGPSYIQPSGNIGFPALTPTSAASTSTSSSAASKQGGGLSPGAGAGIAIFVLAFVACAGGLVYWVWRKRQAAAAAAHQRLDDEKTHGPDGSNTNTLTSHVSVRRNANNLAAPRLSLRPVTDMSFGSMQEKQAAIGAAALAPVAAAISSKAEAAHNPFGDDAATAAPVKPTPPLGDSDPLKSWPARPTNAPVNGAAAPAAAIPLGPGAAQPRGPPPNNVHRVQLDFKPTMDDELEIKAGQLVRMLHEYDDGWALCIRLDRSQQGVLPRNCLSKLPVKPRAPGNGPPPAPGQRGPRPAGPGSPSMNGPPQNRQRTQSNAVPGSVERPSSPGPFGQGQYTTSGESRPRSSSAGGIVAAAVSSTEPSPVSSDAGSPVHGDMPARKPVPGQAM